MKNAGKIIIRYCQPEELGRVVIITNRAYDTPFSADKITTQAHSTIGELEDEINNKGVKVLVAEKDGQLIGAVRYMPYGKNSIWLGRLVVLPDFRQHGIGAMLMEKVTEIAKKEGREGILLDACEEKGLPPYYEKMGFIKIKKREHSKLTVYIMGKRV